MNVFSPKAKLRRVGCRISDGTNTSSWPCGPTFNWFDIGSLCFKIYDAMSTSLIATLSTQYHHKKLITVQCSRQRRNSKENENCLYDGMHYAHPHNLLRRSGALGRGLARGRSVAGISTAAIVVCRPIRVVIVVASIARKTATMRVEIMWYW